MLYLHILLLLTCVFHYIGGGYAALTDTVDGVNPTPIVGVLAQEVYPDGLIARKYPKSNYGSFIAASYVKFVEGAGGRVVPLWIGMDRSYYEKIMSKINGVLLPGGAVWFNATGGYGESGEHIIHIAQEMNDRGIYMPVWGTCLGMELLVYTLANQSEARTSCNSQAQALPLEFKADFKESRLFAGASDEIIEIWQKEHVTVNWHMFCYTEETFAEMKLNDIWRVMSLNHDWNGTEFISSIEHKKYPFYGLQFHPEKNLYEYSSRRNITHTSVATRSSQYFADFLVSEARKNTQHFANSSEENSVLIFNYNPEFTGAIGSTYVQQYLFEEGVGRESVGKGSAHALHSFPFLIMSFNLFIFCHLM